MGAMKNLSIELGELDDLLNEYMGPTELEFNTVTTTDKGGDVNTEWKLTLTIPLESKDRLRHILETYGALLDRAGLDCE